MSFLDCSPSVFVIGDEYEILLNLTDHGLVSLRVGDAVYYEENSGALPTERTVARIRLPQSALDAAKSYEIVFCKAIERKAYFSEFEDPETETFPFAPLPTEGPVNIYFTADVHYCFESAVRAASYFGDDLHLLIAGGDLGEVETEENYLEVCRFLASITHGRLPILFFRGNHDTRGRLAERFTDYFPADGKRTYFSFDLGRFAGVVLDCGEDKPDAHREYGKYNGAAVYNGTNIFEIFRRRETEFLKSLTLPTDKPLLAFSHICPFMTTRTPGDVFDIERELYTEWGRELERLGIDVMLTGHLHEFILLEPNNGRSILPHTFPLLVGAELKNKKSLGTAITLTENGMTYRLTDEELTVVREGYLPFGK